MDKNVKDWEDKKALVSSENGLFIYKKIVQKAANYLKKDSKLQKKHLPQIIFEIGQNQENSVKSLLLDTNFKDIQAFKDLANINRWITATI